MNLTSKELGASFLVAGTTIGAGMLALPIAVSKIGLLPASVIFVLIWLLMYYNAMVLVDLSIDLKQAVNLPEMAKINNSKFLSYLSLFSIIFLFIPLLAAYISGVTSIIRTSLEIDNIIISCVFTIIFGGIIYSSFKIVDLINRILFIVKIICLFLIAILLAKSLKSTNISGIMVMDSGSYLEAIPILFTSFGFHGSIPSVIKYIGLERKSLKKVFLIGSFIPLLIYILWVILSLGVIPESGEYSLANLSKNNDDLGFFISALTSQAPYPIFSSLIKGFSLLAIVTSFIGVGIGLYDTLQEVVKSKITACCLTFCLPLVITIFYPAGFIKLLGFASISLCLIAIIIPCSLTLKHKPKALIYLSIILGVVFIILELFLIK